MLPGEVPLPLQGLSQVEEILIALPVLLCVSTESKVVSGAKKVMS